MWTATAPTEEEDVGPIASRRLGSALLLYAPLLPCYLLAERLALPPPALLPRLIQSDFLLGLSAFFRCPMIDRTGVLGSACILRTAVLDPWVEPDPSFDLRLADIMDSRAAQILSQASVEGREVEVLWSGGIDSTAVVVAFLRRLQAADDGGGAEPVASAPQLVVRCSNSSVEDEYPWFFVSGSTRLELAQPLARRVAATAHPVWLRRL